MPRSKRNRLGCTLVALLVASPLGGAATGGAIVHADNPTAIPDTLGDLEHQTAALADGLRRPARVSEDVESVALHLVNAQIAFGMGSYDEAALGLFDLVAENRVTRVGDYDIALYYLAESLYQKGDKAASRTYFTQLVDEVGPPAKYYANALARLVELHLALGSGEDDVAADATRVEGWLTALDRAAVGERRSLAVYIRGKYAFAQGKPDDAIAYFVDVRRDSSLVMQAQYFIGTAYIAKQDFAKAVQTFTDLGAQKPRSVSDRRVQELAQLALGRLFYERGQPSASIDAYLMIDRRSDLFPDALHEVAWVYVKSKQFDKALRALELLALADPMSQKTPQVRILEANLRIRKAQMLKGANVMLPDEPANDTGSASADAPIVQASALAVQATPATAEDEYGKARDMFSGLHDAYAPSYVELKRLTDSNADPTAFLAQISGRSSRAFQLNATMPEIAAAWLRDELDVARVVGVENDLADIAHNIEGSEETIQRLEAMLASPTGANIYPGLAQRRARLWSIADEVIKMRADVADQLVALGVGGGGATTARQVLGTELAGRLDIELAYYVKLTSDQAEFDKLDAQVTALDAVIGHAKAESAALRHWARWLAILRPPMAGPAAGGSPTPPAVPAAPVDPAATGPGQAAIEHTLDEVEPELGTAQQEIDDLREAIAFGHDVAGISDATVLQARDLRARLKAAQDTEQQTQAAAASGGRDAAAVQKLIDLAAQAARLAAQLAEIDAKIDGYIVAASADVTVELAKQRAALDGYRVEFAALERESHVVGGLVLRGSVGVVKDKLYDVVIRSDLGVVDVSWSRKEEADEDLKRYGLARTRELKQIRDEFRDLLDEVQKAPGATP